MKNFRNHSLWVLLIVTLAVFFVELVIMTLLLPSLGFKNDLHASLIDSCTLVATLYPVFLYFIYLPLRREIRLRKDSEAAKDDLIAIVSHEIKNPLTAIDTSVQLLRHLKPSSDDSQARMHQLLDQITSSTHRMSRFTSDLLSAMQLEAGQFPIELSHVDVRGLIQEITELYQPIAERKSLRLEAIVSEAVSNLSCDRERVFQVISNLLGNAIKFTDSGGLIRIKVLQEPDSLLFEVSDTGRGIPENEIPKVLEKFWQAKGNQYIGTGLGLYVSRKIVDSHGGQIWVKSKRGEGSSVSFRLPSKRPAA